MLHHLLMMLASVIRFLRRWAIRFSLVIFLLAMNVATLVSNAVYDVLSRVVWGAVEMVSDGMAERRPKTRAEMEADVSRARAEADVAGAEADASRDEAKRARTELDATKREVTVAEGRLDQERARNRSLAVELEAKDRRAVALAAEVDASRKGRQQAIDAASSLRSRLVKSIRRDTSAEAIGAVPLIGTAVFLGSVAYELNDACQQLRELEGLDAALRGKEVAPVSESMCLMSYEDMVAALTGKDRAYAKCVSDRIATNDLNPPSCAGYDPALPVIADSPLPQDSPAALLPIIE